MLPQAPPDVVRKINGVDKHLHNAFQMGIKDLHSFSQSRSAQGYQFAHTPILTSPPIMGRKVNVQAPYQITQTGEVVLVPRSSALSMRLRKRMRCDPQIALGLAAMKAPIMAAFEAIRVDCKDDKIAAFVQHILMNEGGGILRRIVYTALKSLEFGYIAHEKVWANGRYVKFDWMDPIEGTLKSVAMRNATVLEDVCDLDPEFTEVIVDGKSGEYIGVRYVSDENQRLEAERTLLVTHDKEFGDLLGRPVLDNVHKVWQWCDIIYLFTNRYFERKASPPIKARAPSTIVDPSTGAAEPGTTYMAAMLESLIAEGVVVLPSELQSEGGGRSDHFVWDVEYMTDDKRGDMFLRYIEHLQTLKLRGILIPEMVIERGADAGTFGMAKAHTDTFTGMLTLLLEEILQHINRFIIPELVFHNFGSNAPSCSIDTLVKIGERKDLLEELLIEVIKAEAEAGTVDTARMINIITLLRQLNIHPSERRSMPLVDAQAEIDQAKSKVELRTSEVEAETAELQLKTAQEAPPLGDPILGGGVVPGGGNGQPPSNNPGSGPVKKKEQQQV